MTEHAAVESLRRQHAFDALARPTWRTNERPGTVRFWRPPALPRPRVQLLGLAEDAVYALAGLLLAATALFALAASGLALMPAIAAHTGGAEPFVALALIAAVRRILVLTAEEHRLIDGDPAAFQRLLLELGVLTGLILALVVALAVLRRARAQSPGHPA